MILEPSTATPAAIPVWQDANIVILRGGGEVSFFKTDPITALNSSFAVLSGVIKRQNPLLRIASRRDPLWRRQRVRALLR
jgi:uridylate kinase